MRRGVRRPESVLLDRKALLLVAALMLSPLAQAQFVNVSLYGNLNMDVELVNGAQADGSICRNDGQPARTVKVR